MTDKRIEAAAPDLLEELKRQCDNMQFFLDRVTIPDQWYEKLSTEMNAARAAIAAYTAGSEPVSVISGAELVKEAICFCDEELDCYNGPEYDADCEVCCQRSNSLIRELVRRLEATTPQPAVPPGYVLVPVDALLAERTRATEAERERCAKIVEANLSGMTFDRFHVDGNPVKNTSGHDLFVSVEEARMLLKRRAAVVRIGE